MYNMVFEWGNYLTTEERKQKKQLDTGKRCCPCSEDVPLFWKINCRISETDFRHLILNFGQTISAGS